MKYSDLDKCQAHTNCRLLFHGTDYNKHHKILRDGLKGGDNTVGGNRGRWGHAILFTTPNLQTAQKYGEVILIHLTEELFCSLQFRDINDQLGDKCLILEAESWNDILISSDVLTSPAEDFELGHISEEEYNFYTVFE